VFHVFGDWVSTQLVIVQATAYGLDPRQNELNPFLAVFADQPVVQLGIMLTVGLGLVSGLLYEDYRLRVGASESTRAGRLGLWLVIALGAGIVAWNLSSAVLLAFA